MIEVNVFYNSLIIIKKLNNSYITRKYIENFGKRFEQFILQDLSKMDIREQVLDFLGIIFKIQFIGNEIIAMKVSEYLMMVREDGSLFKLINVALKRGRIVMSNKHFALLLRIKLQNILTNRIKQMPSVENIDFGDEYNEKIAALNEKYHIVYGPVTNLSGEQPPCISEMINKGKETHHLDHISRLTLAIYLKSKNYDEDYILDIFRGLSDYSEKTTKYQLSRLDRYKCYSCSKMETEGICKKELDSTGKCGVINNPFNF